ncbi:MAG: FmdB family transcriptional regulator [Pirellulaceae bacterium]|jgi:predicted nucleic acid-binding Zn ribbon protein|nr:FmdB family transcriptional regulator [Pirellulaceae bacterium]
MPLYAYEAVTGDDSPGEQFEIFQKMSDPPLTVHPETGQPIRRVFTAPAVGGKWSDSAMAKSVADDKKLDRLGFTKYVKSGDGTYEKRAGKGPDVISRDAALGPGDL